MQDDLLMETVPETTREGDVLYRTEIRDGYGHLRAASALTASRVTATRDGIDLLAELRSALPDAKPFHDEALKLFAGAA